MGELPAKLAHRSFGGKEVMSNCTVMGLKEYPSLPVEEVQALKEIIGSLSPEYQCNPISFESVWKKCIDSINHACSKLGSDYWYHNITLYFSSAVYFTLNKYLKH